MIGNLSDTIYLIMGAGIVVKLVLLLLFSFSIASWAIIVIKYLYIKKAYDESLIFLEFFWSIDNLSEAFAKAQATFSSPVARVFITGYQELLKWEKHRKSKKQNDDLNAIISNIKRTLRRSINIELTRLNQLVTFLATAGNTAPFIGLFGTVWGIMESFHGIGQSGSSSLAIVAPGISEALIATAAGLLVAIPSVIAYNYFLQKIKVLDSEMQSFAADFLNIIESDILRGKGK